MKKCLIATAVLAASVSTIAGVLPQTVTVTINNIIATSNVSLVSAGIVSVWGTPGNIQFINIPKTNVFKISKLNQGFMKHVNGMGALTNVFLSTPSAGFPAAPYYIKFGIVNSKTKQTIFPSSCKILLNATKTINSILIHQNYCTVS